MNSPRKCINLSYHNSQVKKAMEKMGVKHGDVKAQVAWVEKYSPKERTYSCSRCPSDGLCRYVNRYGFSEN